MTSRRGLLFLGLALAGVAGAAAVSILRPARVGRMLLPLWIKRSADIPYGPYPENRLTLLESRWGGGGVRPAVLVFHGGGWQYGNREEMEYPACRRWVKMGFLVANAEYRLGALAQAAEDASAALRWLGANAQRLGADPHRIVVTGVSAGGTLALLSAFRSGVPVAAVVNFYGPTDLNSLLQSPRFRDALPQSIPESDARESSPVTWIRPGLPAVFSAQGTNDELVPPSQTRLLTGALRNAGNDAEEILIEGGEHGFSEAHSNIAYAAIAQFLQKRGILGR